MYGEGDSDHREHAEVLLAVDLHLQVNLTGSDIGRLYLEKQCVVVLFLLDDRFAKPSKSIPKVVDGFLDGFSIDLNQIERKGRPAPRTSIFSYSRTALIQVQS